MRNGIVRWRCTAYRRSEDECWISPVVGLAGFEPAVLPQVKRTPESIKAAIRCLITRDTGGRVKMALWKEPVGRLEEGRPARAPPSARSRPVAACGSSSSARPARCRSCDRPRAGEGHRRLASQTPEFQDHAAGSSYAKIPIASASFSIGKPITLVNEPSTLAIKSPRSSWAA